MVLVCPKIDKRAQNGVFSFLKIAVLIKAMMHLWKQYVKMLDFLHGDNYQEKI